MPISKSLKPSTQANPGTLIWNDFSGGLNADHAAWPLALAENELSDILNYKYVRQGNLVKLKSRDGLTHYSTAGGAGGAIKDIFYFSTTSGAVYVVVVADSDLMRTTTYAGEVFTKIGDLASTRGRMCQFNDKLIVADGGILKFWDGTTFSTLVDSANGSLLDSLKSYSSYSYVPLFNGAYIRAAQYFTTQAWGAETKTLVSMTVKLKKVGSPTGNITAKIYASDGTTVVETSSTTLDSATVATDYTEYSFVFTGAVSSSTTYYFALLYNGGDASNYVAVLTTTVAGVIGDTYTYAASWSIVTPSDLIIKISSTSTAPSATFVIQKQNRIYCNDVLHPNWLWFCNANDPNDWSTVNGGGKIIFDGHYQLNGAFVWNNAIYVFADYPRAIYKLTGDSPDEYTIADDPWRGVTAVSQDVIQDVGPDLIFEDTRGIMSLKTIIQTGDVEKSIISRDKVNNTYVTPNWVCPGGYSVPCTPISGKTISDTQYWFTNWHSGYLIIYDQELSIWTRFQLGVVPTAFTTIGGVTYIGTSSGDIYYLDETKNQDNGTDFNLIALTNWHDLYVLQEKDLRFVDSVLISASQETYDLEIYLNLSTTVKKTLSLVSLSQNGAFQSPYCGNLNEVNFNFKQIQAKVTNVVSGTGPHWLDRIVVEAAILSHY